MIDTKKTSVSASFNRIDEIANSTTGMLRKMEIFCNLVETQTVPTVKSITKLDHLDKIMWSYYQFKLAKDVFNPLFEKNILDVELEERGFSEETLQAEKLKIKLNKLIGVLNSSDYKLLIDTMRNCTINYQQTSTVFKSLETSSLVSMPMQLIQKVPLLLNDLLRDLDKEGRTQTLSTEVASIRNAITEITKKITEINETKRIIEQRFADNFKQYFPAVFVETMITGKTIATEKFDDLLHHRDSVNKLIKQANPDKLFAYLVKIQFCPDNEKVLNEIKNLCGVIKEQPQPVVRKNKLELDVNKEIEKQLSANNGVLLKAISESNRHAVESKIPKLTRKPDALATPLTNVPSYILTNQLQTKLASAKTSLDASPLRITARRLSFGSDQPYTQFLNTQNVRMVLSAMPSAKELVGNNISVQGHLAKFKAGGVLPENLYVFDFTENWEKQEQHAGAKFAGPEDWALYGVPIDNVIRLPLKDHSSVTENYRSFSVESMLGYCEKVNQVIAEAKQHGQKVGFVVHCNAGRSRSGQFAISAKTLLALSDPQTYGNYSSLHQILREFHLERKGVRADVLQFNTFGQRFNLITSWYLLQQKFPQNIERAINDPQNLSNIALDINAFLKIYLTESSDYEKFLLKQNQGSYEAKYEQVFSDVIYRMFISNPQNSYKILVKLDKEALTGLHNLLNKTLLNESKKSEFLTTINRAKEETPFIYELKENVQKGDLNKLVNIFMENLAYFKAYHSRLNLFALISGQTIKQIANSITGESIKLFTAVPKNEWEDIKTYQDHNESLKKQPCKTAMADWFNKLAGFVVQNIVNEKDIAKRTLILENWISVANELYNQKNFFALHAVLSGGLGNSSVFNLKATWAGLPQTSLDTVARLKEVLDTSNNSYNVRSELLIHRDGILASTILSDLTFAHEGPTKVANEDGALQIDLNGNSINPAQNVMQKMLGEIQQKQGLVNVRPEINITNKELMSSIEKVIVDDNEWYKKSKECEPRNQVTEPSGTINKRRLQPKIFDTILSSNQLLANLDQQLVGFIKAKNIYPFNMTRNEVIKLNAILANPPATKKLQKILGKYGINLSKSEVGQLKTEHYINSINSSLLVNLLRQAIGTGRLQSKTAHAVLGRSTKQVVEQLNDVTKSNDFQKMETLLMEFNIKISSIELASLSKADQTLNNTKIFSYLGNLEKLENLIVVLGKDNVLATFKEKHDNVIKEIEKLSEQIEKNLPKHLVDLQKNIDNAIKSRSELNLISNPNIKDHLQIKVAELSAYINALKKIQDDSKKIPEMLDKLSHGTEFMFARKATISASQISGVYGGLIAVSKKLTDVNEALINITEAIIDLKKQLPVGFKHSPETIKMGLEKCLRELDFYEQKIFLVADSLSKNEKDTLLFELKTLRDFANNNLTTLNHVANVVSEKKQVLEVKAKSNTALAAVVFGIAGAALLGPVGAIGGLAFGYGVGRVAKAASHLGLFKDRINKPAAHEKTTEKQEDLTPTEKGPKI